MVDYGKEWEKRFSEAWRNSFPDNLLERLYDVTSGFKSVDTPSDYFALLNGKLVYLECKTTKLATLNFNAFIQLDRMLERVKYEGVKGYVVIWYRTQQKVVIVDVEEAEKMRQDGCKSIALSMLDKKLYNIIEIPITIGRAPSYYPSCDFRVMKEVI